MVNRSYLLRSQVRLEYLLTTAWIPLAYPVFCAEVSVCPGVMRIQNLDTTHRHVLAQVLLAHVDAPFTRAIDIARKMRPFAWPACG